MRHLTASDQQLSVPEDSLGPLWEDGKLRLREEGPNGQHESKVTVVNPGDRIRTHASRPRRLRTRSFLRAPRVASRASPGKPEGAGPGLRRGLRPRPYA